MRGREGGRAREVDISVWIMKLFLHTWMLENMAGSAKMSVNIFTKPSTMVRIVDKYTKSWGQRYRGSTGLTATTGIGMNRAGAGVVGWAADSSPVC